MMHITKLTKDEIVMSHKGGLELFVFIMIYIPIIIPTGIA